ncbi:MAG: hypothetical protein SGILL_002245 [Bacillariaceae sp.]
MFLKRTSEKRSKKSFYRDGAVGTEAVAAESERINKRQFQYPEQGFVSRIEHSLLYAMVREPDVFPQETVSKAIEEEDFTMYFYVRPKPRTTVKEHEVSYAQLSATLAMAGEEWPHDSQIPPLLCRKITHCVTRYADDHELDRKHEIDELLYPLYRYVKRREHAQSIKMLPWLVPALGASVVTVNPLPFYAAFMASNVIEAKNIEKGATSTANTNRMLESGERVGNAEKSSLLDEDYGPEEQNEEDVVIDWS